MLVFILEFTEVFGIYNFGVRGAANLHEEFWGVNFEAIPWEKSSVSEMIKKLKTINFFIPV